MSDNFTVSSISEITRIGVWDSVICIIDGIEEDIGDTFGGTWSRCEWIEGDWASTDGGNVGDDEVAEVEGDAEDGRNVGDETVDIEGDAEDGNSWALTNNSCSLDRSPKVMCRAAGCCNRSAHGIWNRTWKPPSAAVMTSCESSGW